MMLTAFQDIMMLITQLLSITKTNHPRLVLDLDPWTACPFMVCSANYGLLPTNQLIVLKVDPLQTNKYDCSIWTLASVAVILQGYD